MDLRIKEVGMGIWKERDIHKIIDKLKETQVYKDKAKSIEYWCGVLFCSLGFLRDRHYDIKDLLRVSYANFIMQLLANSIEKKDIDYLSLDFSKLRMEFFEKMEDFLKDFKLAEIQKHYAEFGPDSNKVEFENDVREKIEKHKVLDVLKSKNLLEDYEKIENRIKMLLGISFLEYMAKVDDEFKKEIPWTEKRMHALREHALSDDGRTNIRRFFGHYYFADEYFKVLTHLYTKD